MPGVANYIGGSRHQLAAARQHPERSSQRRYFAEHRYGRELSRLDQDRRKERMELGFAWAPKAGEGKIVGQPRTSTLSKRRSAPADDEARQDQAEASPPSKKVRTSAILNALDKDPVVSFDLHRRRLLAEDDWAGLDIKIESSPPRHDTESSRKSSLGGADRSKERARRPRVRLQEARTSIHLSTGPPRPAGADEPATAPNIPHAGPSTRLSLSDDVNVDIDESLQSFADVEPDLTYSLFSLGPPVDSPAPSAAVESVGAHARSPISTAGRLSSRSRPVDDRNLERLASPPSASIASTTRPILADNPRSIFSALAHPDALSRQAAPSLSPILAYNGHASARSTARTANGSSSPSQSPLRSANVSVTQRILSGKEPLRASLATIMLDAPKDARREPDDECAAGHSFSTPVAASTESLPVDPQPLPNPFIYLAAALKLKNLVGSASSDS